MVVIRLVSGLGIKEGGYPYVRMRGLSKIGSVGKGGGGGGPSRVVVCAARSKLTGVRAAFSNSAI